MTREARLNALIAARGCLRIPLPLSTEFQAAIKDLVDECEIRIRRTMKYSR